MGLFEATEKMYAEIEAAGCYPQVASGHLDMTLRGERVEAAYVTTEVSVDSVEGVQMELQLVALTRSRLILWAGREQSGTDEEDGAEPAVPGEEGHDAAPTLHTQVRVLRLTKINDVRIFTTVKNPGAYQRGDLPDAVRMIVVMDMLDEAATSHHDEGSEASDPSSCQHSSTSIMHDALIVTETQQASAGEKVASLIEVAHRLADLISAR